MWSLIQDLRCSFRAFRMNPGITAVVIITLALGVGATTATFSIVSGVLLRPLPYADSENLVVLWTHTTERADARGWISRGLYAALRDQSQTLEAMAILDGHSTVLRGQGTPERIRGISASASCLSMLGARPALGRLFTIGEDEDSRPRTLILSHGLWTRRFGADPTVIGRTLELDDGAYTIVGVLEEGFSLTREHLPMVVRSEYWVPVPLGPEEVQDHLHDWYGLIARLGPNVTTVQAQAEMNTIAARLTQHLPDKYPPDRGFSVEVVPFVDQVVAEARQTLWLLFGAIGLVLLVACANVAGLMLARALGRRQELGIRLALGAGRRRVIRQLLTESLLLSLIGGALGLLVAWWGLLPLLHIGQRAIPRCDEIGMNPLIVVFALGVSALTSVVFGLIPALRASSVDPGSILRDRGRHVAGPGSRGRFRGSLRHGLVVGQITLSFTLLIGAGLLIHSFLRLQRVDAGFSSERVLSFQLAAVGREYRNSTSVIRFYEEIHDRIAALPGIESTGGVSIVPFGPNFSSCPIEAEHRDDAFAPPVTAESRVVMWDYFDTMRIPLLAGRYFDDRDAADAPLVAIVDERFARRFWPDADPIGERFRLADFPDVCMTVVGVVAPVKHYELDAEPRITFYQPHAQCPWQYMYVMARTVSDPTDMTKAVSGAIWDVDPNLPLMRIATMEQRVADSLAIRRFLLLVLTGFAGLALILAMVGLYGLQTYLVGRRTRDIGIRMALGARPGTVLLGVLRQGSLLTAIGLAIGLVASLAGVRLLAGLLYEVSPLDPATFAGVTALIFLTTSLACYLPARSATRVDPAIALRCE